MQDFKSSSEILTEDNIRKLFDNCINIIEHREKVELAQYLYNLYKSKCDQITNLNIIEKNIVNNISTDILKEDNSKKRKSIPILTELINKKVKVNCRDINKFLEEDIIKCNKQSIKEYFKETGKKLYVSRTLNFNVFIYFNRLIISKYQYDNEKIKTAASRLFKRFKDFICEVQHKPEVNNESSKFMTYEESKKECDRISSLQNQYQSGTLFPGNSVARAQYLDMTSSTNYIFPVNNI